MSAIIKLLFKANSCENIHKLYYFLCLHATRLHEPATVKLKSHRTACQRHERSFTHNNNPSKSALTGLWVITVLSLECFVFRFACSVSKANNHSLFTVWVGLFFPSLGQITHKSDSSQRKRGPTASLASGKCSLKSRGQGRWLQPCSLLTLWQGQQRAGDMDILYSCMPTTINCLP